MNERRKIVIQTGNEADDSLSTPHFDTEATLTARPVVPLAEGVAGQAYDPRRARTGKSWSPWLLVLIVLGAVSLGVATGLAIGFYNKRQTTTPPVASESAAPAPEDANASQTVEPPAPTPLPKQEEEARASVPEVLEEPSIQPKDEKTERAARDERDDDAADNRKATPPVVPEKRRERDDEVAEDYDDDAEERRAERQRRREERRERRRRDRDLERPAEFPRDIERAGREQINRIRDIFEGRQP